MKPFLFIAVTCLCAQTALADRHNAPGLKMAKDAFSAIPGSDSGSVGIEDILAYAETVRASMDSNDSGAIELEEFTAWGFGLRNLAEDQERAAAFDTALRVVHAAWDVDADGQVSAPEHTLAMSGDFLRADKDRDNRLTQDEFLNGFLIMHAMRAAIRDSEDSDGH